jgi:autotransporter-associated beta strand protein
MMAAWAGACMGLCGVILGGSHTRVARIRAARIPWRGLLLAAAALIAAALPVTAQNATWDAAPVNPNFNNAANWTPATVPTGTAFFNASAITNLSFSANTTINGWTFNGGTGYGFDNGTHVVRFNGAGIVVHGAGIIGINNEDELRFGNSSSAANAEIFNDVGTVTFAKTSTAADASIQSNGALVFTKSASAGRATIDSITNGLVAFRDASTAGTATIGNGGTSSLLMFTNTSSAGRATIITGSRFDMSGLTDGGMTAGSIAGGGNLFLGGNALTVGSNNLSTIVSGVFSDGGISGGTGGSLIKVGLGTLTLSGSNTYTGATTINAGTLEVDGSVAPSSGVTVNSGATLTGTGTLSRTTVNSGGTFAPGSGTPGTSMTVAGNLAFQSGAIYLVQVNPSAATSANVSGTATLTGASVSAVFASGSYVPKQYVILTATGGLGGTTFTGLTTTNAPPSLSESLRYSANTVTLNLAANFTVAGLSVNQQSVATTLTNYFNASGGIPSQFANLTAAGLTQIDGEVATGSQVVAFQLMDQFLNLMLDPFVYGRLGFDAGSGGGPTMNFAPDVQTILPPDATLACAGIFKAPPLAPFEQRWTSWAASYGGVNSTTGVTSVGSSNITASTYGFAAGMDYHYSPDTIFGFALGGAGSNWGLASGLGTGRSDAFQTGVYGTTRSGPAYLAGALAFANNWFTTNRAAPGDELTGTFTGQSYGARLEGGYRVPLVPALVPHSIIGVTPYGALQVQDFHTQPFSEADLTGGGFGLSYASMNATDVRTELGARFDDPTTVAGMPLVLLGRLAWAHDFVTNPALNAAFEVLPGTSFTVNGAPMPQNSALATAGAELFITTRWSLIAKLEGQFAPGSDTYAGTGTLRYTW